MVDILLDWDSSILYVLWCTCSTTSVRLVLLVENGEDVKDLKLYFWIFVENLL